MLSSTFVAIVLQVLQQLHKHIIAPLSSTSSSTFCFIFGNYGEKKNVFYPVFFPFLQLFFVRVTRGKAVHVKRGQEDLYFSANFQHCVN